jgi:hypothetical protein
MSIFDEIFRQISRPIWIQNSNVIAFNIHIHDYISDDACHIKCPNKLHEICNYVYSIPGGDCLPPLPPPRGGLMTSLQQARSRRWSLTDSCRLEAAWSDSGPASLPQVLAEDTAGERREELQSAQNCPPQPPARRTPSRTNSVGSGDRHTAPARPLRTRQVTSPTQPQQQTVLRRTDSSNPAQRVRVSLKSATCACWLYQIFIYNFYFCCQSHIFKVEAWCLS